ncbi:MAG TPA: hypothetical protein VNX29_11530 [Kaistia sp.]|nr:hypothetical protein [Kaistia sp.]
MKTIETLGFAAAVLCLGAMAVSGPLKIAEAYAESSIVYTAVIDAGSSGSRIALYEVRPGTYPEVRAIGQRKRIPGDEGIDNFLDHRGGVDKNLGPDAVGEAVIGPLLDAVAPALKERGVRDGDVIVDLLATAGMRSMLKPIGTHDPAEIEAFYDGIRHFIAKKGFAVGDIRTIDGSAEEGLWTWIDVNDRYRDAFRGDKAPVGVVEIGGSSVQVSYPTAAAPDAAKNIYAVTINDRSFSVFDRSYIGLGPDDARKAMRIETRPAMAGDAVSPPGCSRPRIQAISSTAGWSGLPARQRSSPPAAVPPIRPCCRSALPRSALPTSSAAPAPSMASRQRASRSRRSAPRRSARPGQSCPRPSQPNAPRPMR